MHTCMKLFIFLTYFVEFPLILDFLIYVLLYTYFGVLLGFLLFHSQSMLILKAKCYSIEIHSKITSLYMQLLAVSKNLIISHWRMRLYVRYKTDCCFSHQSTLWRKQMQLQTQSASIIQFVISRWHMINKWHQFQHSSRELYCTHQCQSTLGLMRSHQ